MSDLVGEVVILKHEDGLLLQLLIKTFICLNPTDWNTSLYENLLTFFTLKSKRYMDFLLNSEKLVMDVQF